MTTQSTRDLIATTLMTHRFGGDTEAVAHHRSRYGTAVRDFWAEALEQADVLIAAGITASAPPVDQRERIADVFMRHRYAADDEHLAYIRRRPSARSR